MKSMTSVDKSNIRAVVLSIATDMQKIKFLQEGIKDAAKGLEEKYKDTDDTITAASIKLLAKLHLAPAEEVVEKQEKANSPYELYDMIMRNSDTSAYDYDNDLDEEE